MNRQFHPSYRHYIITSFASTCSNELDLMYYMIERIGVQKVWFFIFSSKPYVVQACIQLGYRGKKCLNMHGK